MVNTAISMLNTTDSRSCIGKEPMSCKKIICYFAPDFVAEYSVSICGHLLGDRRYAKFNVLGGYALFLDPIQLANVWRE